VRKVAASMSFAANASIYRSKSNALSHAAISKAAPRSVGTSS